MNSKPIKTSSGGFCCDCLSGKPFKVDVDFKNPFGNSFEYLEQKTSFLVTWTKKVWKLRQEDLMQTKILNIQEFEMVKLIFFKLYFL